MKIIRTQRKTPIAISIAAILTASATNQAVAQENNETPEASEIELIQVTGTRASLKRALNAKRFAEQIMDGISAEDIGKLPDNNVAEALSRVAGVSMSRADGEGEFVSVRGMAPNLNKVTLNGQSLSGSGNGNVSPGTLGAGRGFDLNAIGSEMVSALEVFKSPTANMQEGAIGGTVNLKTRTPLQVGNKLSLRAKGSYDTTAEESGVGLSTFFGLVNEEETFGVSGSVNYFDRATQRNSMESRGWSRQTKGAYTQAAGYTDEGVFRIEDIRSNFRFDERERVNGSVAFQWTPTDDIDARLDTFFSKQERDFLSTNWDVDFRDSDKQKVDVASIVIEEGNVVAQTSLNGKTNFEQTGFDRLYDDSSSAVNLTVDVDRGDWVFTPSAGLSQSSSTISWLSANFGSKVYPIGYSFPNGSYNPTIILPEDQSAMQPDAMFLESLKTRYMNVEEDNTYLQFDADLELMGDVFSSLELGARASKKTRERIYLDSGNLRNAAKDLAGGNIYLSDYGVAVSVNNMLDAAPVDNWIRPDFDKLFTDFGHLDPRKPQPRNEWNLDERINAIYVQGNINTELNGIGVTGNIGVRYVKTDMDLGAYTLLRGEDIVPNNIEVDYSDTLPSVNLNFLLTDDVIFRTAAAKVMSRPNYGDLAPTIRETRDDQYVTGNPYLEPYRADTFDISAEWYFNPEGLLSAGLFFKDVKSFITRDTLTEFPGIESENDYTVRAPINGFGASVQGIELSYQQAFENGLGVLLNYTYNDSDTELTNPDTGEFMPLPGLSEDNYNVVVYYDKDSVNLRLAYNYRSSYFDIFSFSGEAHFIDDFGQLDFGASYDINKKMSVTLNATNLTDELSHEFVGNSSRGYAVRQNGRRYEVGFSYKF